MEHCDGSVWPVGDVCGRLGSVGGGSCYDIRGSSFCLALEEARVALISEWKANGIGVIAIGILGKGKAEHSRLQQDFAAVRT